MGGGVGWEEVWDGRRCGDMRKEGMEVFNRRGEGE